MLWVCACIHADVEFDWARGRLFDHTAATVLYEMTLEAGQAEVLSVEHMPRTKFKPLPLSTVCIIALK